MNMRILRKFLEHKAYLIRKHALEMTTQAGSGHPTSALSAADLVAALFFYAMRFDPDNFNNPHNDHFILSKGHASPALYAVWKEIGKVTHEELLTYRRIDSVLEGHPTPRFAYAEAATGSLGMGLSIGTGMALIAHRERLDSHTYVVLGDAEIAEGSVWEAAEIASYYKLGNLTAILDDNRLGQSTESLHGHHTQRYADKFTAFGWHVTIIDGHNMQEIMRALDKVREYTNKPTVIIAKTYKGYGVSSFEDREGWHGKVIEQKNLAHVLAGLEQRFSQAAHFDESLYQWQPVLPPRAKVEKSASAQPVIPKYKMGDEIPTRKAYGQALADLASVYPSIISLDAEVKNSTYAEIFEQKFPDRFVQCFVAEQNMISMGVGVARCGKVPFISTFGAFFTRAFDQIRMAAIGSSPLRLVGSHAGVSIGEDGPSQMALEDIAMMATLPGSVILYPSDAVSTQVLVQRMAEHDEGISYLRTTRMATPVIYPNDESFVIGGCKVLRSSDQDRVCVIGAGITVHQALAAYDLLLKEGISIAVIDLYSVKPLDQQTILRVAQASGKRIITVEDHYLQGGLGQLVAYAVRNTGVTVDCLAVTQLPCSGKPEELLARMGIDAQAIVKAVKK